MKKVTAIRKFEYRWLFLLHICHSKQNLYILQCNTCTERKGSHRYL